jgi:hypothetical protein
VEPNFHLWERWSQTSTFGKGGAKLPPLGKVEPNCKQFWFYLFLKGKFAQLLLKVVRLSQIANNISKFINVTYN